VKIGYARTSTVRQDAGLEAQLVILQREECEEVYQEKVSSVEPRAQLDAAIRGLRKGDVLGHQARSAGAILGACNLPWEQDR
jgi:DNA invertase Pin-like site-specific DNA recombinase